MSDETPRTSIDVAREVQAIFASAEQLEAAMDALRLRGFDRHDLSLPFASPTVSAATPEAGTASSLTEIDRQQARTLGGSTAGVAAALGGALVTVATGGAALAAVGVAAAAGVLTGGAAHAMLAAGGEAQKADRHEAAAAGELVLAVAVRDEERERVALETLRQAGATRVEALERRSAIIS